MKRYATIVFSLLAMVGLVTGVLAKIRKEQVVQVRFNKRDLPKHGVQLITSVDPEFALTVSNHFKNRSTDSPENLQPFSVFIKNSGNKSIVAYMLVWQLVKPNGQVLINRTAYAEAGVLMGNPIPSSPSFKHISAIQPNEVRCFSWSGAIDEKEVGLGGAESIQSKRVEGLPPAEPAAIRAQLTAELSEATDLTVSLDGVFFDDGTFVGPNTTGYFGQIQAMVKAKVDLVHDVAIAREQGKVDEAFEAIKAKSLAPKVRITPESSPDDHYNYYMKIFAGEMTEMRGAYGTEGFADYLKNLDKHSRPSLRKELGGEPWSERD